MSTQVQYRRGTSSQNDAFTGALAEITVDTTNWVLRVADGVTAGGYSMVGLNSTQTLTNKVYNGTSVSVSGNITTASKALVGVSSTTLTNPVGVFSGSGASYDQVAIINSTGTGSADLAVYANNGDDTQSWSDIGFTGNAFSDTNYTISKPGDGYFFVQGNTSFGGNLIVATGNTGNTRDIVFSFGFLAANEFLRFQRSTNTILPYANATANIGSTTNRFNTVFATATSAQYADVAEKYSSDGYYPPGTVLSFGGSQEVTATTKSHVTSIAGVVSTNPAYLMNAGASGDIIVDVALLGRVPCNVVGNISKGDRLVSSDIPGVAQALESTLYQPGCIIGKALENYNSSQVGVIEVVVGRV